VGGGGRVLVATHRILVSSPRPPRPFRGRGRVGTPRPACLVRFPPRRASRTAMGRAACEWRPGYIACRGGSSFFPRPRPPPAPWPPPPVGRVFPPAVLECYVVEEWIHYAVHFHRFRIRYFDFIRRHPLFHHGVRGRDVAFGLTSSVWDVPFKTAAPHAVRIDR